MEDPKRVLCGTLEIIAFGISLAAINKITNGDLMGYMGLWGLIPYFGAAYLCGDGIRRLAEGMMGDYEPQEEQTTERKTEDLYTSLERTTS